MSPKTWAPKTCKKSSFTTICPPSSTAKRRWRRYASSRCRASLANRIRNIWSRYWRAYIATTSSISTSCTIGETTAAAKTRTEPEVCSACSDIIIISINSGKRRPVTMQDSLFTWLTCGMTCIRYTFSVYSWLHSWKIAPSTYINKAVIVCPMLVHTLSLLHRAEEGINVYFTLHCLDTTLHLAYLTPPVKNLLLRTKQSLMLYSITYCVYKVLCDESDNMCFTYDTHTCSYKLEELVYHSVNLTSIIERKCFSSRILAMLSVSVRQQDMSCRLTETESLWS